MKSWSRLGQTGSGFSYHILNQEVIAIIFRCKENELDLGQVIDEVSPRTKAGTGLDDWYNGTLTILVGLAAFNK